MKEMYIKKHGNIKDYQPIKHINNSYVISWGLTQYEQTNIYNWKYFIIDDSASFIDIKNVILKYINDLTQYHIINKFIWNNMKISLTVEDQLNYKRLLDITQLMNGENLPVIVKFKNIIDSNPISYEFETLDDMKDFIINMNNHIMKNLEIGHQMKESINWEDYKLS